MSQIQQVMNIHVDMNIYVKTFYGVAITKIGNNSNNSNTNNVYLLGFFWFKPNSPLESVYIIFVHLF